MVHVLFPFPVGHAAAARTDRGWAHFFVCRKIACRRGKRERALIKKENKILLLCIRKFRVEQLQSGRASS
jgi:hypothetical protein